MSFLSILLILCLFLSWEGSVIGTDEKELTRFPQEMEDFSFVSTERRLQKEMKGKRGARKMNKLERTSRIIDSIESHPIPIDLTPKSFNKAHNTTANVVLSVAMSQTLMARDAKSFVGTLRNTGFTGDIVIGVVSNAREDFIEQLERLNAIVYEVKIDCGGTQNITSHGTNCRFTNGVEASINMIRYYLYMQWAVKYSTESYVLLSDFNDVFFQSNPFTYKIDEWINQYQLVAYLEAHPNVVIKRCRFNGGWISNCYGKEALQRVGSNTASCSGNTLGTRNAILVYNYLMTRQMDPAVRYGKRSVPPLANERCVSVGMDQGFHNWLLYSGILGNYMDLKIYEQGEGAVNVMGGFWGPQKTLTFNLEDWKILRGEKPYQHIYNWDGEYSPVVHQLNRFLAGELSQGYKHSLAVFQDL